MQYRVEELAAAGGVKVDTVRFYQGKGLIPPPERRGRSAIYSEQHLMRIRQIRTLLGRGFSLAQIERLPGPGEAPPGELASEQSEAALLAALAHASASERALTRTELAAEAGVPDELIAAALKAGLLEPSLVGGESRFSIADAEMLRSGLALVGAGIPLAELLALATRYADDVRRLCEQGIDLFDDHIRKVAGRDEDPEVVARSFQVLTPKVTRLVALHFQRTLVNRAVERLRSKGEGPALERALEAVTALPAAPMIDGETNR